MTVAARRRSSRPSTLIEELRSHSGQLDVDFGDAEHGELVTSVELLDPRASKGLEFDHVVSSSLR